LFSFALRPFRAKGAENNTPSLVLGLFGLSQQTTEADLKALFSKYGEIDRLTLIYDKATGISRGFGFMSDHTHIRNQQLCNNERRAEPVMRNCE
jgi:RNA recognition motif-containing protein